MKLVAAAVLFGVMTGPALADEDNMKKCWSAAETLVLQSPSLCRPYWEVVKEIYRTCERQHRITVVELGGGRQGEMVARLYRAQFVGDLVQRIVYAQGACLDHGLLADGVWE